MVHGAACARTLRAQDLAALTPGERAALLAALRELNLTRVALLLAALPPAAQRWSRRCKRCWSSTSTCQLCALLEQGATPLAGMIVD